MSAYDDILVSIIMPVYNSKKYLEAAVDSILAQTHTKWEFIIVNEFGSNDGSLEMLNEYALKDERFVIVQNEKRLRISASLNLAIDLSKGKYIARMDADDISLPERLEKQVAFMEENPDVAMCGTFFKSIGKIGVEWEICTDPDLLKSNLLFYSPSVHPTVMFRSSFLKETGLRYNDDYYATEDYDFFSRIGHAGKISNVGEVLFNYRLMDNNATYVNNDIGKKIYLDIMRAQFEQLGLDVDEEICKILSPHHSLYSKSGKDVVRSFARADLFLKNLILANERLKIYDRKSLLITLNRRFRELYETAKRRSSDPIIDLIWNNSILRFNKIEYLDTVVSESPLISVVLPTYNSDGYLLDALWSILNQTCGDYEVLIINEYGSNDNASLAAGMFNDSRIRIIQNSEKLGLAESLNVGINEARGRYIARCDSDDVSSPDRFKVQLEYMESHPACGLCGTWQRHYSTEFEWTHKPPVSHEDLRARLLFDCEVCHSTVFLRKEIFLTNNLFYKTGIFAEDWELWNRAIEVTVFHTIPEILGEYREDVGNITREKMDDLLIESAKMTASNIKDTFGIRIREEHIPFMTGWKNMFSELNDAEKAKALDEEKDVLMQIWYSNDSLHIINADSLMDSLEHRWCKVSGSVYRGKKYKSIEKMFYPSVLSKLCVRIKKKI